MESTGTLAAPVVDLNFCLLIYYKHRFVNFKLCLCIYRPDAIVNIYSELSSVLRRNSSIAGSFSEPHNASGATIGASRHECLLVQITTRGVEVPRVRYNFHGVNAVLREERSFVAEGVAKLCTLFSY